MKNRELKTSETKKVVPEYIFEDVSDFTRYIGKIKNVEDDDYILTLYKKGKIFRRFRKIKDDNDLSNEQKSTKKIKYREII